MKTTRRTRRTRSRNQIVETAREARFALARVIEKTLARRRELLREDGDPQVVALTDADRVEALHMALVWLQRAENHTRQLRALIERQLEYESKEAL